MLLQVMLHSSLTMDICPGPDSIHPLSLYSEVSNTLHNKHCGNMNDTILEHRIMQMHSSNKHRKLSVIYHANNLVYLSTKKLALPKGWVRKLMSRFLGPYRIPKAMNALSNITIKLLPELKDRRISPTFHTNLV